MAGKRSRGTPLEDAIADHDSDTTRPTSSTARKRVKSNAPRPTQTLIEIDSEDEALKEDPRLPGALRGLNPSNMLSPAVTQKSIEGIGPDAPGATQVHETRSLRHGEAQVNYSAKYHPMDEVTRPKRAQRITGSRSLSAAVSHHDTSSSDNEPELVSGESTDGDDANEDSSDELESNAMRKPDPRATRHSKRSEAQKSVNYSRSHHPQDHSLPGYQHLSKRRKHGHRRAKPPKKKARTVETIALSSDKVVKSESDSDDTEQPVAAAARPVFSSPRKRLKSLGRHYDDRSRTSPTDHRKSMPTLPRGESSMNPAEAIIQGLHAVPAERRHFENDHQPRSDDSNTTYVSEKSTRMIGNEAAAMLENLETPANTTSNPGSEDNNKVSSSVDKPAPVSPHVEQDAKTLMTPSSALLIERPYLNSQARFSSRKDHSPEATQPVVGVVATSLHCDSSSKQQPLPRVAQSVVKPVATGGEGGSISTENATTSTTTQLQRGATKGPGINSAQLANEDTHDAHSGAFEQAGTERRASRAARAHSETASLLVSQPASRHVSSRQVSRDTLSDHGHFTSSFFEEAMAGTQGCSQRVYEDHFFSPLRGLSEPHIPSRDTMRSSPSAAQNIHCELPSNRPRESLRSSSGGPVNGAMPGGSTTEQLEHCPSSHALPMPSLGPTAAPSELSSDSMLLAASDA